MARGTRADATCTQGHMAEPRKEPRWLERMRTRTRGRGHASPRGCTGGATWRVTGLAGEGPMG